MKTKVLAALSVLLLSGIMALAANAAENSYNKHVEESVKLLQEMEKQPEAAAVAHALKNGIGVAIFPKVLNIAVGVGGMGGDGLVLTKQGDGKWFGPSFARIAGASLGLQAGVEESGLIFIINNAEGLAQFTEGKSFKLGADAGVTAGPWSADLDTSKVTKGNEPIYAYSVEKGVFAGISVKGAMIEPIKDLDRDYWGKELPVNEVLSLQAEGKVAPLTEALNNLMKKAK